MLSNQPEQRPRQDDLEGGPTTDRQCAAPDEAPCLDEALVVSASQRSTSPFMFIPVGSDQYPKALAAFAKATTEPETLVPYLWQRFRDKVASGGSVAIDFAAGAEGRHIHMLLDAGFSKVYAGDCDPASCAALRRAFSDSKVSVIQDDILAMDPPEAVDAGLLIHVGYPSHVDAKAWPRYIRHCMETLAPGGQLFVVLAHHVAGSFKALEHFGAPRVDLIDQTWELVRDSLPAYKFEYDMVDAHVNPPDEETALLIMRWFLSDQPPSAFDPARAVEPLSEDAFVAYVREHLYNPDTGILGWPSPPVILTIMRRAACRGSDNHRNRNSP